MKIIMQNIKDARIEQHGEVFLVSNPSVGAISALTSGDLVAFQLLGESGGASEPLIAFYQSLGLDKREALDMTQTFQTRIKNDGWTRAEYPYIPGQPLAAVYMTINRECNLSCPYCYQGLSQRKGKVMSIERVKEVFDSIAKIRPDCHIILTGGEPLMHPNIYEIFDLIDSHDFILTLLTNGILIDEKIAQRLKSIKRLEVVQVSLDGMTEDTFAQSRGKRSMDKVRIGLDHLIDAQLPFMVAPTLHLGNLHEIADMAEWAVDNGGYIKPNNLRHLPFDFNKTVDDEGQEIAKLVLPQDALVKAARDLDNNLIKKYGQEKIYALKNRFIGRTNCFIDDHNAKSGCGFGWSLLDIDWDGDVYPCHLAKAPELKLGNLFMTPLANLLGLADERGIRRKSNELTNCSQCNFVSRCAGGCRVGAYYGNGSFDREDDLCKYNYTGSLERILAPVIEELTAVPPHS